ncbi:MAG: N-acetyl-gamma-glutamyl-phosphate reductase [Candidatus Omnitrophica bacterium]|nr:N-acetyl-gamma-glutamyl-phosphate reductase [Candidatus Omnitrophota bacterium]
MIKVSVVGATGYTGQELVWILSKHPEVRITGLCSRVEKPIAYSEMFPKFKGAVDDLCVNFDIDEVCAKSDIIFLSLPHTVSTAFVPQLLAKNKKIIDLSADYRLDKTDYEKWYKFEHKDQSGLEKAVYGLPELNLEKIKKAQLIANPGCYPTSVLLALLPVLEQKVITGTIIADAKSGVSGAGRKADLALSYCEVNESFKAYKINEHQHMPEIEKIIKSVTDIDINMNFVPHLLPINRGIFSTVYVTLTKDLSQDEIITLYKDYYSGKPFVRIYPNGKYPQIKDVVNTNFCDIGLKVKGNILTIVSAIDNLVKGAAGQAVQNMNIIYGFDQKKGLI